MRRRLPYDLDLRASRTLALWLALVVSLLVVPDLAGAAINQQVNFQGRITDPTGFAVPDGSYNVEFKLHGDAAATGGAQGACSGSCLWMETRTTTSKVVVSRGMFSVQLGSVSSLGGFDFDQDPLYLSVRVGGTTDTPSWDGEMTPRHRLAAAPQAVHAANSSRLGGQAGSYYTNATNLGSGTVADARLSTNVALRNVNNGFATSQTVTGTVAATDFSCADCINASDLAVGAVGSSEIIDANIALADLASGSVDSSKIVDASVALADIAAAVWPAVNGSGTTLPVAAAANNGHLFVDTDDDGGTLYRSNGTSWVQVARGATEASTAGDVVCSGCVQTADIADGTIASADIADGTVAGADLAPGVAVPVGTILPFWGTVLPANFAWADGSSLSCGTYVALCAAQGASGSVVLPDMRGRAPIGPDGAANRLAVSGDTFGAAGGAERHTLTTSEVPSHTHGSGTLTFSRSVRTEMQYLGDRYNDYLGQAGWGAISGWYNDPSNAIGGNTAAEGGGQPHSSMQPYQVVNYMIRVA